VAAISSGRGVDGFVQLDVGTGGGSVSAGDSVSTLAAGAAEASSAATAGGAVQAPEGRGEFVDIGRLASRTRRR